MQINVTDIRRGDRFSDERGTYIALRAATPFTPGRFGPRVNIRVVKDQADTIGTDGIMDLGEAAERRTRMIQRTTDRTVEIHDRQLPISHSSDNAPQYADRVNPNLGTTDRESAADSLRIRIPRVIGRIDNLGSERDILIRQALAAGIPVIELVQLTELSRARIYQIRDGRR